MPALAARGRPAATGPLIIAGHITAAGQRPGGPAERAKMFLDALRDDRKSGPKYQDLGAPAPLLDDTPRHVGGLALEVRLGGPATQYLIGTRLRVAGQLPAEVPVRVRGTPTTSPAPPASMPASPLAGSPSARPPEQRVSLRWSWTRCR